MSFPRFCWSCLLVTLLFNGLIKAQMAMNFVRFDSVPVYANTQLLSMAWAGGMDMLQYSEIDLNQDGIKDLFVFDRSGNKITTYVNLGTANQVSYVLAPQYVYNFPVMHDWVLLRDYNCDGKEDIFTYSIAGFSIYENTSTVSSGLQFQLKELLVNTDRSPNSSHFIGNLYVSPIDLPAIRDLDGDGDLDILTFSNGGSQVEYHKNMSMERYGVCDSIEYIVQSNCWGKFSENASNASIIMNSGCLPVPLAPNGGDNLRLQVLHSGSCMECFNFDGDTVQDVLIGDVGSPHIVYVHNSTWPDSAIVDAWDSAYPAANIPVNVALFPCPAHIDVNNDGKRDLLFSPSAITYNANKFSSLYYKNTGSNSAVVANYQQNNFLQENMIDVGDGCYPVFYDYDLDGDLDLLIGNHGYYSATGPYQSKIALFSNSGGPTNPIFSLATDDFAGIFAANYGLMNMAPTFGDLDGDGDKDMLIGDFSGQVHFFRKGTGPQNYTLVTANYQSIDVGDFAVPQLFDVNGDNKLDLLIGAKNGKISYFENTGTIAAPVFTLMSSNFGGVNVCEPAWYTGFATPVMFKDNGSRALIVGSQRGWIYRYDNIDGNLGGTFTLTDSQYVSWREGGNTMPAIGDVNGDGLYDVVIGNYAGGVSFFKGDNNVSTFNIDHNINDHVTVFPNPVNNDMTIETDFVNSETKFSLSDAAGKIVRTGTMINRYTVVSCTDLAPGLYILFINTPSGIITRKVIINRE